MERPIDHHTKPLTQAKNPPPQVLIVDDEPSARATLEALLYPEGYNLAFAANGQTALSLVAELEPDVILLDVMMPDTDGFTICQHLKAEKRWQHIPVIIVTALDSKEDLARGLEAGADEFLSKPVNGLELRARVRSMLRIKRQYDSLEATMHMREDLASMIAHDMRNLLSPIIGFSQILAIMTNLTETERVEFAETVYSQANRLSSFIDDILLLAKMEQNHLILNCIPVNMNSLIYEVENTHRFVAQSKDISLVVDLPAESQSVTLDRNLFQRLLDNLISNALKFAPARSTVTLKLEYPSITKTSHTLEKTTLVRIKIADEGPGISIENRERIFDKFETIALKKSGVPQVGLGLAFCKMVTEAHGGCIFVEANQPVGSIFIVEL